MKKLMLAVCLPVCLSVPSPALADGDQALGRTLYESGEGYGLVSTGVGLSGRLREIEGPNAAVTTGTLVLEGIPDGAEIRHAYLYWVIYGSPDDTTVTLDGATVTGTVIGRGGGTCWGQPNSMGMIAPQAAFLTAAGNVSYRADVTAMVTGDGEFVIGGFPSVTASADTQGASLVVVYDDPARADFGTIVLHDGMGVVNAETGAVEVHIALPEVAPTDLWMHLGVGDGQSLLSDGPLFFGDAALPPPGGGVAQHYRSSDGRYWDSPIYDLVDIGVAGSIGPDTTLVSELESDCVAFAYVAFDLRTPDAIPGGDEPDAGMLDAGMSDAGGMDAGGRDGGEIVDAGDEDSGATDGGADGGGTVGTDGGCGCRVPTRRAPWAVGPFALTWLAVTMRRRKR